MESICFFILKCFLSIVGLHNLSVHCATLNESFRSQSSRINENLFKIVNEWKYLDFEYPTFVERQLAIKNGDFIPKNNLPLGIDVYRNRLFITTPRWKDGVPASLVTVPYPTKEISPPVQPYPNWQAHSNPYNPDCTKLISVYRTSIDAQCNRLWLIDSGIVNATISLNQICPTKIVAFDLNTDEMVVRYEFPATQIKEDSLHSNIVVDIKNKECMSAHAIVTDVWRFGIVVYSLAKNRSWRVTNYNFSPNPVAADFNIYGLSFQWLDGVFGMSLSPFDRILYFHPMASFKEFIVSLDTLLNESLWINGTVNTSKFFTSIGDRGFMGQSSTSGIDRNGVMFYTQVHKDNIGCWDTKKPYTRNNLGMLLDSDFNSSMLIQFPNDLKVDNEESQSVWVMSNRLPIYLYSQLDYGDINFRILRANIDSVIENTVCNPKLKAANQQKSVLVSIEEGQCY